MRLRLVAPAGALTLILTLAACGTSSDTDAAGEVSAPPSAPSEPAPTAEPVPSEPVPSAPSEPSVPVPDELDFSAPTVDGGTFEGASLVGKPAVLWFWAPWCPICLGEAPLIADLATQYDGQVSFVGVAGLSGDLNAMKGFIDDGGVGAITHIDDRDGEVYTRFGVTQQYDIGFVSADGVVNVVTGPLSEDEIAAEVERLVGG